MKSFGLEEDTDVLGLEDIDPSEIMGLGEDDDEDSDDDGDDDGDDDEGDDDDEA